MGRAKERAGAGNRGRRLAAGFGMGAGAALLLSALVNVVYSLTYGLSPGATLAQLAQGLAFRPSFLRSFVEAFFYAMLDEGSFLPLCLLLFLLVFLLLLPLFSYFGGRNGMAGLLGAGLGGLLLSLTAVLPQLPISVAAVFWGGACFASLAVRRCEDEFFALAACCGGALLVTFLAFSLFGLLLGENAFLLFTDSLALMLGTALSRLSRVSAYGNLELPYLTPSQGQEIFLTAFLSLFFYTALIAGTVNFLLARRGAQREEALAFVPTPFYNWRLPDSFIVGMVLLCAFGWLGMGQGWPRFDLVNSCFLMIVSVALTVQGIALLLFTAWRMRIYWPLALAALFFLRSGLAVFATIGIFEQFFNLRGRMQVLALASFLSRQNRRGRRGGGGASFDPREVSEMMERAEGMSPEEFARLQEELLAKGRGKAEKEDPAAKNDQDQEKDDEEK